MEPNDGQAPVHISEFQRSFEESSVGGADLWSFPSWSQPHPDPTRMWSHLVPCSHPQGAEIKLALRRSRLRPTSYPDPINRHLTGHPAPMWQQRSSTATKKIRLMLTCNEYMTPTSASVRTGGMERNEVRPPISHVVVYIPCILKKSVHNYAIFSSFYCSMETPTIIRVGTRNYITRIALYHKNMYWYTCITRKVTRPENDMVLV